MPPRADIVDNLRSVRRRIDAAAHKSHRDPADIQLIAVSKTFDAEHVRAAISAGQIAFGENRVQEGLAKVDALRDAAAEWHLIGHLQSNKAKRAVGAFRWIQSVDSVDLLQKLDRAAAELGIRPQILIQVDLAHEETKYGVPEADLAAIVTVAVDARSLDLRGLMIVPPFPETPEESRPWFRRLRDRRDRLIDDGIPAERLAHLSMGMSHDFEIAIEEGATMVRVGTAIFGTRPPVAGA
jgi:pyridoxal phosphate enzyme (YggS family)